MLLLAESSWIAMSHSLKIEIMAFQSGILSQMQNTQVTTLVPLLLRTGGRIRKLEQGFVGYKWILLELSSPRIVHYIEILRSL